jgi:hypothetical protein
MSTFDAVNKALGVEGSACAVDERCNVVLLRFGDMLAAARRNGYHSRDTRPRAPFSSPSSCQCQWVCARATAQWAHCLLAHTHLSSLSHPGANAAFSKENSPVLRTAGSCQCTQGALAGNDYHGGILGVHWQFTTIVQWTQPKPKAQKCKGELETPTHTTNH